MNKGLKKGLKITGVTVAVILVFMLVLPFMFKDKVITIVKKEANEMLNAKLDFESLDISLFSHFPSASIELNGLTLSGIDDFENDTLVSAESIDVAVNVMSLFSDKGFDVNYVVLDKPSIKAVKLAAPSLQGFFGKKDGCAIYLFFLIAFQNASHRIFSVKALAA